MKNYVLYICIRNLTLKPKWHVVLMLNAYMRVWKWASAYACEIILLKNIVYKVVISHNM